MVSMKSSLSAYPIKCLKTFMSIMNCAKGINKHHKGYSYSAMKSTHCVYKMLSKVE